MTASTSPASRYVKRIVSALRRLAEDGQSRLAFSGLVDALGNRAHRVLILLLTLLNMIPGPPGFGGTVAWTTFVVALAMALNRPIRLPGLIGNRNLPLPALLKASEQVARVTDFIARFSRPRLRWLTGAAATIPYAIFTMVISVVMTIPIPFTNAVPNVGLCIIAFSMLNRDGVGVMIGVALALLGLVAAGAIALGAFHLGSMALDSVM